MSATWSGVPGLDSRAESERQKADVHRDKGGVCSEHAFSGTSWTALTLGSWQIADGSATPKAAARGTSVGDFRVRFVVEP